MIIVRAEWGFVGDAYELIYCAVFRLLFVFIFLISSLDYSALFDFMCILVFVAQFNFHFYLLVDSLALFSFINRKQNDSWMFEMSECRDDYFENIHFVG